MFNPYTKAILAAALALLGGLASGWDDSVLTTTEIATAATLAFGALAAVWATKPVLKWLSSGVIAGAGALAIALQDDAISAQEWITIGSVTVGALYLVYQTANTKASSEPNPTNG
jgi:hypothetical protein